MTKIKAASLSVGDVILPPARELSLWMRRRVAELGLPDSALHITVTSVEPSEPDKRGAWMVVRGHGGLLSQWAIKVRPWTPWPIIASPSADAAYYNSVRNTGAIVPSQLSASVEG